MRYLDLIYGLLPIAAILLAWEIIADSGIIPAAFLPSITRIATVLYEALRLQGTFSVYNIPSNISATLVRMVLGFCIDVAIVVPLGLIIGSSRKVYMLLEPTIEVFRTLPGVVLIPFFILIVGINDQMYVLFVAFSCSWPVLINTVDGVRSIDPLLKDVGRSFKLSGFRQFFKITLPASSPYIVSGLRISLLLALLVEIATELVTGRNGLGWSLAYAQGVSNISMLYAQLFVIAILGFLINFAFTQGENRYMAWHKKFVKGPSA